ncbi:thioredoxin family protein [Candidatus Micrarchaeota archaeon]|nr:thioredoxin family protein [Candidatus Micrarchaeota archaeon]
MKLLLILLLALGLFLAGCTSNQTNLTSQNDSMQKLPASMNKSTTEPIAKSDSGSMQKNASSGVMINKTGTLMTDRSSVGYVPLERSLFESARSSGKFIFLEFYANWCPTCAAQKPVLEGAFADLNSSNLAAFQVNYRDSQTDEFEILLAKEYGISSQHTHVLLTPEGKVILKSNEMWTKEDLLRVLSTAGVR